MYIYIYIYIYIYSALRLERRVVDELDGADRVPANLSTNTHDLPTNIMSTNIISTKIA